MFSTIKSYLIAAGAAVVIIFAAIFKYRGGKIDSLEENLEEVKQEAAVATEVAKDTAKVEKFEAVNEQAAESVKDGRDLDEINHHFYDV